MLVLLLLARTVVVVVTQLGLVVLRPLGLPTTGILRHLTGIRRVIYAVVGKETVLVSD